MVTKVINLIGYSQNKRSDKDIGQIKVQERARETVPIANKISEMVNYFTPFVTHSTVCVCDK